MARSATRCCPWCPASTSTRSGGELAGTPSRVGTYLMVYRVADADGDVDELRFMIDVVYARRERRI